MPVLLVVGGAELEVGSLCAALARCACRGALLLTEHRLKLHLSELEVGSQTEEAAYAGHQTHVAGERHVAGLDEFDYFVLLAIVLQLHVLRVKVEGCFGVVVQVQVYLVAHLAV